LAKVSRGKKVPPNKNMCMMKRKMGKLKTSMWGTKAVKHMAADPKAKSPTKAMGKIKIAWG
jgi:hypothetical protein